jgi:hypothetical protein
MEVDYGRTSTFCMKEYEVAGTYLRTVYSEIDRRPLLMDLLDERPNQPQ